MGCSALDRDHRITAGDACRGRLRHPGSAVASLAAHRTYLSALSDEPAEEYARAFVEQVTAGDAERFGGRAAVSFELLGQ